MADRCKCRLVHRPRAVVTQLHHVVPTSWLRQGGTSTDPSTVPLCGTAHDLVHDLLNKYVRQGGPEAVGKPVGYGRYVRKLAEEAWAHKPPGKPPYTSSHPGDDPQALA